MKSLQVAISARREKVWCYVNNDQTGERAILYFGVGKGYFKEGTFDLNPNRKVIAVQQCAF